MKVAAFLNLIALTPDTNEHFGFGSGSSDIIQELSYKSGART
jgi:hypothetical protein